MIAMGMAACLVGRLLSEAFSSSFRVRKGSCMDFSKLRKFELHSVKPTARGTDERVSAIIKVRLAGYRPAHVKVRSEIDKFMFTADLKTAQMSELEADPSVVSVSLSQKLPLQRLPTS